MLFKRAMQVRTYAREYNLTLKYFINCPASQISLEGIVTCTSDTLYNTSVWHIQLVRLCRDSMKKQILIKSVFRNLSYLDVGGIHYRIYRNKMSL